MTVLKRNSDLVELIIPASGDQVTIRDISDVTSQATGESKRIAWANFIPLVAGAFICTSGFAVSTINNTNVGSSSFAIFSPVNSAAALIVSGDPSPFVSALHPGSGFAFSTKNGSFFVGTEEFNYFLWK